MSLVRRPARASRFRRRAALGVALVSGALWAGAGAQQFRSSVSLVAVDVQVLDRQGAPIPTLTTDDFEVTIGGRRRRVVSADFVRLVAEPGRPNAGAAGRLIVLAVDTRSFDAATWQRASVAARAFVADLQPDDQVAVYAYPDGPVLLPGTDHARASIAIAGILAAGQPLVTQFNLTSSEVVDIAAESVRLVSPASAVRRTRGQAFDQGADAPTVQAVHLRECPQDPDCPGRILLDANAAVQQLESRAIEGLSGLDGMTRALAEWPGRKTVVLLTRGLAVSDRPGGRPDPGDVSRLIGQAVARANASVYTLYVELNPREQFAASRRSIGRPGAEMAREQRMQSSWLEQFSDAAGGLLLRVGQDAGAAGWRQVLRETSAYYLLGVQPESADRDGRLHTLRVKVGRPGTTVRSRTWVVVPAEP
jgi:VWFA-related protein